MFQTRQNKDTPDSHQTRVFYFPGCTDRVAKYNVIYFLSKYKKIHLNRQNKFGKDCQSSHVAPCAAVGLDWLWVDDFGDLDAVGIPDAVLLQTALHHSTPGRHPGGVVHLAVPGVMPGLLARVVLIFDGDHSSHVDHDLNDDPVMLRVIDGIAAGFGQVSAEVDATAEHPVFRLLETCGQYGLSTLPGGAMVHDVLSTINGCREAQPADAVGHVEVIFSPLALVHVGFGVTAGMRFRGIKVPFKETKDHYK